MSVELPSGQETGQKTGPPQPRQFTLQQLLLVICLVSITLALTTQWRHIGFVVACFVVGIVAGGWRRHAGTFIPCLAGLAVFLTTYAAAWVQLGTNRVMNSGGVRWEVHLLDQIDIALAEYAREHQAFPTSLDELDNTENRFPVNDQGQLANSWKHSLHYRPQGDGYELATLGRDGKLGGIGLDEDIDSSASLRAKPASQLPVWHFAFDTNGSWGIFMAALMGSLMTSHAIWSFANPLQSRSQLVAAAITIAIAASVVAFFLAAFYVAAGNSGH